MAVLNHKIDFLALVSVTKANSNGDPLNGNRPRTDYNGIGEISDVCIKRKIRNRMQDLGNAIFVQSDDRCDDGFKSLSERASTSTAGIKDKDVYAQTACEKWMDVRSFGQVFAFKSNDKSGVSVGVRGPVSVHQAVRVSPVEVESIQITKSVNGEPGEKRASDTMGMKHRVDKGIYVFYGSMNPQLAERTGFSDDDAETIKSLLPKLFENDASSARPEGSMAVKKVFWWKHNCKSGQYSSAKVHKSLTVHADGSYTIDKAATEGLVPEVIDGF